LEVADSGILFFKWDDYFMVRWIYKIILIALGLVDNCFEKECAPFWEASLTTKNKI
jgi:hypothetical protein